MGLKASAEALIQSTFADVGTKRGGEFYLPASAAERYIDACVQQSLVIVGIEMFHLVGGTLRPDLSQIADFSSLLSREQRWETMVQATGAEAHRFIGQAPSETNVLVTFTLLSEKE